jgi:hypothetical protein
MAMIISFFLLATRNQVSAAATARVRHFECFNIVQTISHGKRSGKSTSEITRALSARCAHLQVPRRDVCDFVARHLRNVTGQLAKRRRPREICDALGHAREFGGTRTVPRIACIRTIALIRVHLPAIEAELDPQKTSEERLPQPFVFEGPFGVANICLGTKGDRLMHCHIISRIIMRSMRTELFGPIPGAEICDRMNAANMIHFDKPSKEAQAE